MNRKQVHIEGNQLTISAKKSPLFIRLILTGLLLFSAFIPLFATYFTLTHGDGPHIGIVLSFILGWGVGFYLLRMTLWNSVGREILTLNSNSISYIADYKLFKDGQTEIGTTNLMTEIIYEDEPNIPLGRLRLINDSTFIETVLQTTIEELEEIKTEIKARYNDT